jgi:hypothetical protein
MKKIYSIIILFLALQSGFSQVAITNDASLPDGSAMLDIKSTDKGILIPRMTTSQRTGISSPDAGLLIYDSDQNHFFYFDGTVWVQLVSSSLSIDDLTDASSDQKSLFFGVNAGINNNAGDNTNNTGLGYKTFYSNSSGLKNSSLGYKSLYFNTFASENTSVGAFSLNSNTTGEMNAALGTSANYYNQEGSESVMIGYEAGKSSSLHNKSGDIFIGYQAGYNETGSHKLYIENSNSSSPLIYGEFDNNLLRINGTLDINNAYQFPTTDGTSNQILQTDGSGNVSWVDVVSVGATEIDDLSDGKTGGYSVFLGTWAGSNDDGTDNYNTGVGLQALNDNSSGELNTGLGYKTNYYNQEGNNNTTIGYEAGKGSAIHNKSGNVFIGYQAGFNESGNNKLYIENSNSASPLIYGEFDNDLLRVNGTLDINNAYQFLTTDGTAGQLMRANGDGTLYWSSGSGASEINGWSDGKTGGYSVFIGLNAGSNDDGTANKNTGIGEEALHNNTTGSENVAVGYNSLTNNQSGQDNTAVGYGSLQVIANTNNNTAAGAGALSSCSASENTAVGYGTLIGSTSGTGNTALGIYSLSGNSTGSNNTGAGAMANSNNNEGNNNTMIGYKAGAGSSSHNKSGDVFLGYEAGYNETGSNKLYIENSTASTPLIYGEFDNNLLRINGTLHINSAYQFPLSDGTNGQVLTTNGSGQLTWVTNTESINDLSDAKTSTTNLFLGNNAGSAVTTGTSNTATGIETLKSNTEGSYNSALGYESLYTNTTGDLNTASGYKALLSNSSGDSNTAVGYLSLKSNTSYSNTAVGYATMENNTNGYENTALGYKALHTPAGNTGNAALGHSALQNCNNADYNTAFGYNAIGSVVLTGSYNTAVGQNAHPYSETMEYTATFGYNAVALASGKVKFGDNTQVSWIGGHSAWHNTSDGRFKRNIKEDVPGLAFILKLRPVTYQLNVFALDRFCGLTDSELNNSELAEKNRDKVRTGFIAQEVEKSAKACGFDFDGVYHPQNQHDVYSIAYSEFVVPLVKSIQEQQQEIKQIKAEVENDRIALERLIKLSDDDNTSSSENK